MTTSSLINLNELKFQSKQIQKNYHRKSHRRAFIRLPHIRLSDADVGQSSKWKDPDDLYITLRPFLTLGKFIGLVPIKGLFQHDVKNLTFNKSCFSAIVSTLSCAILSVNIVLGFVRILHGATADAGDYAEAPTYILFFSLGLFIFVYFNRHTLDLIQILGKWNQMNLNFATLDTTLTHDLNLVAFFVMASTVLKNVLYSVFLFSAVSTNFPALDGIHEMENELQTYYDLENGHWASIFPYHSLLAMFVYMNNKVVELAWNYMDLTIALMSRALYGKFKSLNEQGEVLAIAGFKHDAAKWQQLTSDLNTLCTMLFEIANFMSPIIFCSLGMNVYDACLYVNIFLTPPPNRTLIKYIYDLWSTVHLFIRLYIVSISATRVNDWVHRLSKVLRKCPNEAYTTEVERAERFISLNTIGMNGLSCFIVTKPLMLKLASVVLTFEIVLLQLSQPTLNEPACQCANRTS